jgi:hypothetical protein
MSFLKTSDKRIKEILFSYIIPILVVIVPVFLYIAYRAYNISFTHDESLSFFTSKGDPSYFMTPNNHVLNTLLMKLFSNLTGNSEFSLRMPNILAFVLYGISGLALIQNIKKPLIFSLFFISILVFNPLMIEFFGLARGYGLSLGLMMATFYFFLTLDNRELPIRNYFITLFIILFFSLLTIYANLNALNLHIALLIVLIISLIHYLKTNNKPINRLWITAFIALFILDFLALIPAIIRLRTLQQINELAVFGDHDGFINTTLGSLVTSFFYHEQDSPIIFRILYLGSIGLYILAGIWFIYRLSRKLFTNFSRIFVIFSLLVVAPISQDLFFNIPYPVSRTAILYYPAFSLLLIFFFSEIYTSSKFKVLKTIILLFVCAISSLSAYNMIIRINYSSTVEWDYDTHDKEMIEIISRDREALNKINDSITISNFWVFSPALNYYRVTKNYSWLKPMLKEDFKKADYYICNIDDFHKIPSDSLILLKKYDDTKVAIYRDYDFSKK